MAALAVPSLRHLALAALLSPRVEVRRTPAEYAGVARLLGFVEVRWRMLQIDEESGLQHEYDKALGILRDGIGHHELTRLMTAGAAMTEDEAFAQAHALA